MTSLIPIGIARVFNTDSVCGKTSSETKKFTIPDFVCDLGRTAYSKAIASAAAVLSSKREAFASSIPVRSVIIVW